MIAASFTALSVQQNPNGVSFAATFAPPPSLAATRAVTQAVSTLSETQQELGNMLVDAGIASLAPDAFVRSQVFWSEAPPGLNTIIFFAGSFEAKEARRHADSGGLRLRYEAPGTPIRIATDRPLESVPGLVGLVQRIADEGPIPDSH
jgi:hypothetical protein